MFSDRKIELNTLDKAFKSVNSEFFIIYGRRRIGKTELVKELIKEKTHFYYLAKKQDIQSEVKRFADKFAKSQNVYLENTSSFESVFEQIIEKIDKRKKFIIVIDEFPYWIEKDKSIMSEFQIIWDTILKDKNIFLILLGSSVSIMENKVLNIKSPLYGRRTGQLLVGEIPLKYINDFLPTYSFEEQLKVFGVTGGIPFYLKEFNDKLSFEKNLENTIFNKSNILSIEAKILLEEELRDPDRYFNILKAIRDGAVKFSEISSKSYTDITNLSKYLNTLLKLKIIKKDFRVDITAKSKNFIYSINDNYFDFWLKYYYPYEGALEENSSQVVKLTISDYSNYMGHIFENVCKKMLIKYYGVKYPKIGRWWDKQGNEIDIVGLNSDKKKIVFAECKWTNKKVRLKQLKDLIVKKELMTWDIKNRSEEFIYFSKSGFEKSAIDFAKQNDNFHLYDLKRIKKGFE